jgi:uncharacterized protein (DUF2461 family)
VLGSIFRINRDSADKRPYKDHLHFWFWQGERKAAVSGLFLRVSPDGVMVGAGAHAFTNEQLGRYRDAVVDPPTAADLGATVTRLEDAGHEVEGSTYRRTPRGDAATGTSERFLRHSALYVHRHLPAGAAVTDGLLDDLLGTWRTMAPLHTWLVANVQQR